MDFVKISKKNFVIYSSIIACSYILVGWGQVGHSIINRAGAKDFPNRSVVTSAIIQQLTDSASVPDSRSNWPTEPNHFMDMEDITEFSTHSITHNRDSLFQEYGETYIRNTVGMLPWVIDSVMTTLTSQMKSGDWFNAWRSAGDLGHYLGDAHQPLHATTYYNGYTTKYGSASKGIHSRYETTMIKTFQSSLAVDSTAVHIIESPIDTVFAIMYQSNSYMDSVYIADQLGRTSDSKFGTTYYDTLWAHVNYLTISQFRHAAVEYGSFLYTAWMNAGMPSTTTSVQSSSSDAFDFTLEQNHPNPFNPSTLIRFSLASTSIINLRVFDVLGREVAVLANGVCQAGTYSAPFNAGTLRIASGVYFYKLDAINLETGRINTFIKKMLLLK